MANIMERIIKKTDFGDTNVTNRNSVTDKNMIDAINRCSHEIQGLNNKISQLEGKFTKTDLSNQICELEVLLKKIEERLDKKDEERKENQLTDFISIYENKEEEIKTQLTEHIHKEAVKTYRNVQGLLEDNELLNSKSLKPVKIYLRIIIWFLILITALIICNVIGVI